MKESNERTDQPVSSQILNDKFHIERLRNALSGVLMTVLIGVAFQEMVTPVRESVRTSGITLGTSLLAMIFFLTSMRFFIGNQLHLLNEDLLAMRGLVWFYDLIMITLQTVIIVFLGGVSSFEATTGAKITFVDMLIILYVIDVFWIGSQWLFAKFFGASWRRAHIPWGWAILNSAQILCLLALHYLCSEMYTGIGVIALAAINMVAFLVDVFLLDYYDVFENLGFRAKEASE